MKIELELEPDEAGHLIELMLVGVANGGLRPTNRKKFQEVVKELSKAWRAEQPPPALFEKRPT